MQELLGIDEALALILERARPLAAEDAASSDAAGRVLADPARATLDLPPFPSSSMDGFALRSVDTPGELAIVGRVAAGRPSLRALGTGEAMAISTGGAVPEGADAVAPIEGAEDLGATVRIDRSVAPTDNVRQRGSDVPAGSTVVAAGLRLGPAQLGALAAAGVTTVRCSRRPRVAVIVTGSELRTPGEPLGAGQIYDANGAILEAQLESSGALSGRERFVRDDAQALGAAIERGLEADVLVTTGGVSVGEHDLVRATLAGLGVEELFWGVAVRPGRPIAFGAAGATLVFGLPGNPVSALVGFELFVRPALLALQGVAHPRPPFLPGRLAVAARRSPVRDGLLRARARVEADGVVLEPLSGQESHMIARTAGADSLVLVPRGDGELPAGALITYLSLS